MSEVALNDGGPAFPTPPNETMQADEGWVPCHAGMTLRDYFAAKAMQSLILADLAATALNCGVSLTTADGEYDGSDEQRWARSAYSIANVMIAERNHKSYRESVESSRLQP